MATRPPIPLASLRACAGDAARFWHYDDDVTIELSSRLSRSVARTYVERGLIRISHAVTQLSVDRARQVLWHEVAHLVVFKRHGRSAQPHGAEWRALLESAGLVPRVRDLCEADPPKAPSSARQQRRRFRHACPACGSVAFAWMPMRRWRCQDCLASGRPGFLRVERLAP